MKHDGQCHGGGRLALELRDNASLARRSAPFIPIGQPVLAHVRSGFHSERVRSAWSVWRDENRPTFTASTDQLEQHTGLRWFLHDVDEIVQDQHLVPIEAAGRPPLGPTRGHGECGLPPPGGPSSGRLARLSSQPTPALSSETRALEIIGTAAKSKLSSVSSAGSFSPSLRLDAPVGRDASMAALTRFSDVRVVQRFVDTWRGQMPGQCR
jgi:hypothetical protein